MAEEEMMSSDVLPNLILSTDEFLQELGVGDAFYYIQCINEELVGVVGPCRIVELYVSDRDSHMVQYLLEGDDSLDRALHEREDGFRHGHIGDFTNVFHGVIATENRDVAETVLEERRTRFLQDPKLRRIADDAEESRLWSDMVNGPDAAWRQELRA